MLLALVASQAFAAYAPDHVVVAMADTRARVDLSSYGIVSSRPLVPQSARRSSHGTLDRVVVATISSGSDPALVARRLSSAPGVAWAEPDYTGSAGGTVPDDEGFAVQWSLRNEGGHDGWKAGADIDATDAWDVTTGDGVVVAVLDTGADDLEPDFEGQLWTNDAEIPGNGADDDGDGYTDDAMGWDFTSDGPDVRDVDGHGSNVASIVAARADDGVGFAGVCWGCRVMVVQTLDDTGWGLYSQWASGIVYAVDHGARVINMSEGGTDTSALLSTAVAYAHEHGVVVVASMMNDDDDTVYYPAAYDAVIAVGATNQADRRCSPFEWGGGSNWGDHIDLVAPGEEIYGLSPTPGDYTWFYSGTSQAAPHVAGVAALMLSVAPDLGPDDVAQILETTAEDQVGDADDVAGWDPYYGWGRLNAKGAVDAVAGVPTDGDGDGVVAADDCDDADAGRFPGATEVPDDGVDQDCTGADAVTCYADQDGDGAGADAVIDPAGACGDGEAEDAGDCDDGDPGVVECVHPTAPTCACSQADAAGGLLPIALAAVLARRRRRPAAAGVTLASR